MRARQVTLALSLASGSLTGCASTVPTTSSEWAAWVQALGSLLAIGAAWGIANYQYRTAERARARAERDRSQRIEKLCTTAALSIELAMRKVVDAWELRNVEEIQRQLYRLREVIEIARGVPLYELPSEAVEAFVSVRSIAAEALHDAERSDALDVAVNFAHWTDRFRMWLQHAERASDNLRAVFAMA